MTPGEPPNAGCRQRTPAAPTDIPPGSSVPLATITSRQLCGIALLALLTGLSLVALTPWDLAISQSLAELRGGTFGELVQRWGTKPASVLIVGAAFVLTSRVWRTTRPFWTRAAAALTVQLLLQPALLTNGLKLLAGRKRPVHLGPEGEGYTPWYALHPGLGDFSFPSGHVAVAMILAPVVWLWWREGRYRPATLALLALVGWAGTVACGRVASGAHFPTDVAFSVGVGLTLAPLSACLGDRFLGWLARRAGTPRA